MDHPAPGTRWPWRRRSARPPEDVVETMFGCALDAAIAGVESHIARTCARPEEVPG